MVSVIEKTVKEHEIINIRENAIRQEGEVKLSLFNYCFLVYYYLISEIKKHSSYAHGKLLDVGCGFSPYKKYFSHVEYYLKHDHPEAAKDGIKYDCLSELPQINAPSDSFDTIVSFAVLEHVTEPFETLKEFKRILKNNGIFIICVPQYWHLHEEPNDFFRFTKHILKAKVNEIGFEIIYLKELGKSFAVAGQALCNALILLFDLDHVKNIFNFLSGKKVNNIAKSVFYAVCRSPLILLSIILIPIINLTFLILDQLLGSKRDTIGYFVVARKT